MHRSSRRAAALAALAAAPVVAGALAVLVDLAHLRASRTGLDGAPRVVPEAVLVLGFPSRPGGAVHPVQRWRTAIAVRTGEPARTLLVFSGAAPEGGGAGGPSEAAVMAGCARDEFGWPADRIALEESARSTWENVALSLPHLQGAATIAVASSPVHALRARRYLAQQRPDLAARLVPADDHRAGEQLRWKAATLAYDLARSLRLRLPSGLAAFDAPRARVVERGRLPAGADEHQPVVQP
ncbi:ElyC/SanA/YdcF family protein [Kineococcus sp. SYSU DK006]|uniref:ElyC/SanA/YdcF family protein n=1 Tax=Kineococcus sp. SYSU DK006 TaxID=3383127 RepID=UPI003D7CDA5B